MKRDSDIEWAARLSSGDEEAWARVRTEVTAAEMKSPKNREMLRRYSLTEDDLTGMLYEHMIARGKLSLYRGEGSLAGWLRCYVRGFVFSADPHPHGEVSLDASMENDEGNPVERHPPVDDNRAFRREVWNITQKCFMALWDLDPLRAYVHLLKTRFFLSSEETKSFLDVSSAANVDQIYSRNVRFMREQWPEKG